MAQHPGASSWQNHSTRPGLARPACSPSKLGHAAARWFSARHHVDEHRRLADGLRADHGGQFAARQERLPQPVVDLPGLISRKLFQP